MKRQTGVTLVELMVSLAIGLIIALAAATAYVGTRSAATASENVSKINEVGKLALDVIGREVQMAGFYPAQYPSTTTLANVMGSYINSKLPGVAAYDQGIFGCDGAQFNATAGTCPGATANVPDTIVLNYFTSDNIGTVTGTIDAMQGIKRDCNRELVTADSTNVARGTATWPMFVSNRFTTASVTYSSPNGSVTTGALSCSGNGNDAQGYKPLIEGVEDLVVRYGVNNGTGAESPDRFYTAAEVGALPTVIVAGVPLTGWQRVSAVRVCVLVRTQDNSRSTSEAQTYANCRGGTSTNSGRYIYKAFTKTYAARNNLHATY